MIVIGIRGLHEVQLMIVIGSRGLHEDGHDGNTTVTAGMGTT